MSGPGTPGASAHRPCSPARALRPEAGSAEWAQQPWERAPPTGDGRPGPGRAGGQGGGRCSPPPPVQALRVLQGLTQGLAGPGPCRPGWPNRLRGRGVTPTPLPPPTKPTTQGEGEAWGGRWRGHIESQPPLTPPLRPPRESSGAAHPSRWGATAQRPRRRQAPPSADPASTGGSPPGAGRPGAREGDGGEAHADSGTRHYCLWTWRRAATPAPTAGHQKGNEILRGQHRLGSTIRFLRPGGEADFQKRGLPFAKAPLPSGRPG